MPDRLSILCVHGIGHGDVDAALIPAWRQVITAGLQRWKPGLEVDFDFLAYDEEFDHAPLHAGTYAEALTRLAASGIVHGIGDLLPGTRGLSDMPALIRWTAGMIAQWATEDRLRERLRARVLDAVAGGRPDVVCAHSLGTLVCYDAFRRERGALDGRTFVTLGSQIGNPFVRDCFAGRIEALARARRWYHLYNSDDHVFTAELRIQADNFTAVETRFDKPNDPLNHDAIWYFDHANTRNSVWLDLSGSGVDRGMLDGALEAVGPGRLLWACDVTIETGLAKLRALDQLGLSDADRERVRWRNAHDLFAPGALAGPADRA